MPNTEALELPYIAVKQHLLQNLDNNLEKPAIPLYLAQPTHFEPQRLNKLLQWAEKIDLEIIKAKPASDLAAVAFDALTAAKSRSIDIVLLDTAGPLQNKTDLMQELQKTKRICHKVIPDSPHETLLVVHKHVRLTGIILTKLDGSAKGGIILSIYKELGIPIRFIGTLEQAEDLIRSSKLSQSCTKYVKRPSFD